MAASFFLVGFAVPVGGTTFFRFCGCGAEPNLSGSDDVESESVEEDELEEGESEDELSEESPPSPAFFFFFFFVFRCQDL